MAFCFTKSFNLVKIITTRPQNFSQSLKKADGYLRHPMVWPWMLASCFTLASVTYLTACPTGSIVTESPYVHRAVLAELYKKEHGHYQH